MTLDPELPAEDDAATPRPTPDGTDHLAMRSPARRSPGSARRRDAGDTAETEAAPRGPVDATAPPRRVTSLAPIVLGDENRVRQVVANLLGNARRFTPDDSPIGLRVGVDAETDMGWIEVIDHGDGVPEQIREQIFQRFWRADTSRTRETGGSGLGLSIVASIVDLLHGRSRWPTLPVGRDLPGVAAARGASGCQ